MPRFKKPESLTSLHRNVLSLVLAGLLNKEIADQLQMSENVVKNRIQEALWFFGISRTRELFPIIDRVRSELHTK